MRWLSKHAFKVSVRERIYSPQFQSSQGNCRNPVHTSVFFLFAENGLLFMVWAWVSNKWHFGLKPFYVSPLCAFLSEKSTDAKPKGNSCTWHYTRSLLLVIQGNLRAMFPLLVESRTLRDDFLDGCMQFVQMLYTVFFPLVGEFWIWIPFHKATWFVGSL